MKWHEYYKEGLCLSDHEDKSRGMGDFYTDMGGGESFPAVLLTPEMFDDEGEFIDGEAFANELRFGVVLLAIEVATENMLFGVLRIRFKIANGYAPRGLKRGEYTLDFSHGICDNLPEDMFEDEDVPVELLMKRGE